MVHGKMTENVSQNQSSRGLALLAGPLLFAALLGYLPGCDVPPEEDAESAEQAARGARLTPWEPPCDATVPGCLQAPTHPPGNGGGDPPLPPLTPPPPMNPGPKPEPGPKPMEICEAKCGSKHSECDAKASNAYQAADKSTKQKEQAAQQKREDAESWCNVEHLGCSGKCEKTS